MKKLFLIFAVMIINICSLFAQKTTVSKYEIGIFEGTIDKYPITMFLELSSDNNIEMGGYYYYNSVKTPIELIVKHNGGNNYIVHNDNNNEGDVSEIFNGSIDKAGNFKGKWTGGNGKTLDFSLSLSTNYITDAAMVIKVYYEENFLEGGSTSYWESVEGIILNNKNKNPMVDKLNMIINGMDTPVNETSLTEKITKRIKNSRPKNQSVSDYEEEYREGYGYYISGIRYIDDKIIGIIKTDEVDMGGAHGTYTVYQDIYSLQNGKKIETKTKDLFKNINDKSLLALLRIKLAQKSKSYLREDFEGNIFDKPINEIGISDYFIITPKGITLIYQVYDIAPYVFGAVDIEFTYKELKPFIKDNSPLKYLFDK